jgi:catechol 2,3-dioxygenase-like lactoylglutathione lyase family enzyme
MRLPDRDYWGVQIADVLFKLIHHHEALDPSPPHERRYGYSHVSLQVENIDEVLAEVRSAGYEIVREKTPQPAELASGGCFADLADPDGNRIELVAGPAWAAWTEPDGT